MIKDFFIKHKRFFIKNWKIIFAIIYLLLPVDLIPDAIPVLGVSDDLLVLVVMLLWQYLSYRKELKMEKAPVSGKGDIHEGELVE